LNTQLQIESSNQINKRKGSDSNYSLEATETKRGRKSIFNDSESSILNNMFNENESPNDIVIQDLLKKFHGKFKKQQILVSFKESPLRIMKLLIFLYEI
jgi:hypothetical protein